jgi:tetratricopeptide (TPR) repeat protein
MRLRTAAHLFFALALTACAAASARAQGHTIRGKVRNASGANVSRANVQLEQNGTPVNQTVTNNEGDFNFTGLTETSYTLVVSATDYNTATESVEFVRSTSVNSNGETRTVEITLLTKEGVRPPRPGLDFVQDVPREARAAFDAGLRAARENRPADAVSSYESAIKIFPPYFEAHFVLASALAKQGRFDDSIKHLEEARRVNPKDDRVYDLFARVLVLERKYAVAARVYAEAARLNPDEPQYPFAQGVALIEQGATIDPAKSKANADERAYAFAQAEKALMRAYQISFRKLSEVHLQLARLYEKEGDPARAADELEAYLRKVPGAKNADAIRQAVKTLRAQSAQKQ